MTKVFSKISCLLCFLLVIGCQKPIEDPTVDQVVDVPVLPILTGVHTYVGTLSLKVANDTEVYQDATILVDLDQGKFSLIGYFQTAISMSFNGSYKGKGTYQFNDLENYGLDIACQDKALNEYDYMAGGVLEISTNTEDIIIGKCLFKAAPGEVNVEVSFDMKKAAPSLFFSQGSYSYKGSLTIKCGSQSETVPDGQIDVDFDSRSFSLVGGNEMNIDISFDDIYKGAGTYSFPILEPRGLWVTCTNKSGDDFDYAYPTDAGYIRISENTTEKIVGEYEYKGRDFDDNARTVKGTFSMIKI